MMRERWALATSTILWLGAMSLPVVSAGELPVTGGLGLRFDATAFSDLSPGTGITKWQDTSGNDRHAEGGNGWATYGEARTPSGLYAVSFHDLLGEALRFSYNPTDHDITVLAVSRSRQESTGWPYDYKGFIGWGQRSGTDPLALGGFNVTQTVVTLSGYSENERRILAVAHDPATGFTVNTVRLNSTRGVLDIYCDGKLLGELPGITEAVHEAWESGLVGGTDVYRQGWDGDVAEILVYSRALTDAERQAAEDYLHNKWLFALKAYDPSPPDGARNVVVHSLGWTPGDTTVFHDVYLGLMPELGPENLIYRGPSWPVCSGWRVLESPYGLELGDFLSMSYTYTSGVPLYLYWPALEPNTTYYWRVDEVQADGTTHSGWTINTGDVWSFTTASSTTVPTAYDPKPRDGAKFVDPEADLAWNGASSWLSVYHVYFGTSWEDVFNGTGDTFKSSQRATTFDPGPLAGDTTYYWRVDVRYPARPTVGSGQVYTGAIRSFTTRGTEAGIQGEYFNGWDCYGEPAVTRIDPAIDFNWGGGSPDPAIDANSFCVRWTGDLEVAFTDTYTFIVRADGSVRLWIDDKLLSERDESWPPLEVKGRMELTAGQAYPIVMEYLEGSDPAAVQLFWESPSLPREIIPAGPLQPPLRARAPYPADGVQEVPQDGTIVRWTAGCKATHHDVYFGDDANAVANATAASAGIYRGRQPLEATTVAPGPLEWGRTYYWRVDEVNDAEPKSPWKGLVRSFTTADFILVDDFESYDDDCRRIYYTWVDGFGYGGDPACGVAPCPGNGTGSIVGYIDAPFVEVTIAHDGRQSMPFEYNNDESPYYSQADRTWDTPQDWTINGVSDLSLWLFGSPLSFVEKPDGTVMMSGYSDGDAEGTDDAHTFAYRQLNGDGEVLVRVDSLSNSEGWARAGVAIRESPDSGSPYAAVTVTAAHGVSFAHRRRKDAEGVQMNRVGPHVPHWVKLTRRGNTFTAQHSEDGTTWRDILDATGEPVAVTVPMPNSACIGLCVSGYNWQLATAELSGITTTGGITGPWHVASEDNWLPGTNSQGDLYVALEDSQNQLGVVVHPDPGAVGVTKWTSWRVPLSRFADAGVDLTSIQKMHIGVGDRDNPQPDGTGMIHIDDIRVVKPDVREAGL